jgi:rod shape-determining protein MreD
MSPKVKVPALLLAMFVVNTSLLGTIHIDQVRPDAMLLLTVIGALVAGPERGAILGFAAGVLVDLTLQTPFGLSALVLCLVGFAVGQLHSAILRSSWWIPPVTAALGSALGVALFVLIGAIIGESELLQPGLAHLAIVAGLVALMNCVLAAPVWSMTRWAFKSNQPERAFA